MRKHYSYNLLTIDLLFYLSSKSIWYTLPTKDIPTSSYKGAFLPPEYDVDGVDDISSISGLSNLSDLSDNDNDCIDNNDDLDDEIEAIIKRASARDNKRKSDSGAAIKSSIYKSESRRKGELQH